jgi:hypothetical protein
MKYSGNTDSAIAATSVPYVSGLDLRMLTSPS